MTDTVIDGKVDEKAQPVRTLDDTNGNEDNDESSSSSMDSEEVDKILHKKYKRPGFICQYCGEAFTARQTRDYHEGVARCFGKLYTCRRCLKPFAAPWRLERHQRQLVRCDKQDKVIVYRNGKQYITVAYEGDDHNEIESEDGEDGEENEAAV